MIRDAVRVEILVLVVGLMLAAVLLVGVGDRLKLPWPVLMLPLGVAVAFIPGLPDRFDLEPELILPLFLPRASYTTVAADAAMPVGSIGPTRKRALGVLRLGLEQAGYGPDALAA